MEPKRENDEIEIDLGEIFAVLMSKWMLIAASAIAFGLAAYLYATLFITPQFQSTTTIYVMNQQSSDTVTYADLQTGTQLTNDYAVIVNGRAVLEQVISSMGLNCTYGQLYSKVSVNTPANTRFIEITVEDADPYMAKDIADNIRVVASEKILEVMAIDSVNVVEEGNIATSPSSPHVKRIALIGFAAGMFIAVALILLLYLLNDSIRTPDDVERYLGLSTLGTIPLDIELEEQNKKRRRMKRKAERQDKKRKK